MTIISCMFSHWAHLTVSLIPGNTFLKWVEVVSWLYVSCGCGCVCVCFGVCSVPLWPLTQRNCNVSSLTRLTFPPSLSLSLYRGKKLPDCQPTALVQIRGMCGVESVCVCVCVFPGGVIVLYFTSIWLFPGVLIPVRSDWRLWALQLCRNTHTHTHTLFNILALLGRARLRSNKTVILGITGTQHTHTHTHTQSFQRAAAVLWVCVSRRYFPILQ